MTILALITDAFGGQGGIAKFNRDLLTSLCSAPDISHVIALPRLMPNAPEQMPQNLEFVSNGLGGKFRYALAVLKSAFNLSRSPVVRTPVVRGPVVRGPVVLVCGHINLLPLAFLARSLMRLQSLVRGPVVSSPVVLCVHGIDAWQPTRSRLVNRLVRRVDAVIAVSEFTRKKFWTWANPATAKSFILPNCVDLTRFTPGPKPLGLLQRYGLTNKTVLLTVARLSAAERYKGIDEVLEVLPQLSSEFPDLSYLVVGDGDDRPRLMAKARSLGLQVNSFSASDGETSSAREAEEGIREDEGPAGRASGRERVNVAQPDEVFPSQLSSLENQPSSISHLPSSDHRATRVVFAGHIPESEKVDHYRLADAFIMPGRGEGFGIVYLEAMACGVPVIASNLDASREIILRMGEGEAVNPDNPAELRDAIQRVLNNKTRTRPDKLGEYSREAFDDRVHGIMKNFNAAPLKS